MSMTVWRWKAFGLAAVCFVTAATVGLFAAEDLQHLFRGFSERRPIITSAQYSFASLLLTPMVISVGIVFLVSKQATPEEMKNASARSMRWSGRYIMFVAASIVAALIAPNAQYWTVDYLAQRRGYVPCPSPDRPRHQPDRWALPGLHGRTEHCPGNGADPNI